MRCTLNPLIPGTCCNADPDNATDVDSCAVDLLRLPGTLSVVSTGARASASRAYSFPVEDGEFTADTGISFAVRGRLN